MCGVGFLRKSQYKTLPGLLLVTMGNGSNGNLSSCGLRRTGLRGSENSALVCLWLEEEARRAYTWRRQHRLFLLSFGSIECARVTAQLYNHTEGLAAYTCRVWGLICVLIQVSSLFSWSGEIPTCQREMTGLSVFEEADTGLKIIQMYVCMYTPPLVGRVLVC